MIIYSLSKNINVQDLNHTNSEAQRVANLFLEEPGVQVSHCTRNKENRLVIIQGTWKTG